MCVINYEDCNIIILKYSTDLVQGSLLIIVDVKSFLSLLHLLFLKNIHIMCMCVYVCIFMYLYTYSVYM